MSYGVAYGILLINLKSVVSKYYVWPGGDLQQANNMMDYNRILSLWWAPSFKDE